MTNKNLDPALANRYETWCRDYVRNAAMKLALAAAYSERSREHTDAPLGDEQTIWFLVRTISHEWGLDYEYLVERGRERARLES